MIKSLAVAVVLLAGGLGLFLTSSPPARGWLVTAPSGMAPPPGSNNAMVGMEQDPAESPAISGALGRHPDFTIQHAYMNIANSGNQPCTNGGYPTVIAIPHFGNQSPGGGFPYNDPNAAANGSYNSVYAAFANDLAPCANTFYAIRLDWEAPGNWYYHSPWCTCEGANYGSAWITPSVWIAGFQNFVTAIRNNPATAHIKIAWDMPVNYQAGAAHLAYYPGDAYVDIISADIYNGSGYDGQTSGNAGCSYYQNTSAGTAWSNWVSFAAAHNKPMMSPEWGTENNDGQFPACFLAFVHANNFVGESYWDTNDGGCGGCSFSSAGNTKSAWLNKEVGWAPTYGFFGGQIAIPNPPLAGY